MAESSCDAAVVAVTLDGSVDGISHQTQVSPHVIVDVAAINEGEVVDLYSEWVNSIRGKASHKPRKIKASCSSCSIHRIPPSLRHFDEKTYVPQIISIGPLHYAKRKDVLQAMEEHKWRYLHAILGRNGEDCLLRCLRKVKELEEQARECYSEEIDGLDSKSFVEMLVLDACFIIELFCRFSEETCSDIGDPILDLLFPTITTDLIMLENQIPFFILQELSNLMDIPDSLLPDMARYFFSSTSSLRCMFTESSIEYPNLQCHHLLHFLHLNCLLSLENEDPPSEYPGPIPCASELQAAGIKFKKGVASSFLQIKYREGKIEIPPSKISQMAEPMLLNLVAFEQCCPRIKPHITSYIFFMDDLVNSARDVKILSQKGIIIEMLGTSEDIATLFNKLGRDVWMPDIRRNYLNSVSGRIKESTKSVWPKFRATLMRDYFNNPWAFISFLAAVVLLVFTFFQTFFSAFPKFQMQK
eukprot:TRINITY_DN10466_c0_g1_i1.p1 TRINITY_DN10466_c0_g1~~TRINITY_DN10466_c0_g1_i1.p1  ORF type:complete len:510 (-),score=69.43 TRINITY_DN10466_c0_g1_i1:428-1840(-)